MIVAVVCEATPFSGCRRRSRAVIPGSSASHSARMFLLTSELTLNAYTPCATRSSSPFSTSRESSSRETSTPAACAVVIRPAWPAARSVIRAAASMSEDVLQLYPPVDTSAPMRYAVCNWRVSRISPARLGSAIEKFIAHSDCLAAAMSMPTSAS